MDGSLEILLLSEKTGFKGFLRNCIKFLKKVKKTLAHCFEVMYNSTSVRTICVNRKSEMFRHKFLLDKMKNYGYNVIRAGMAEWQTRMVQVHVIAIS